MIRPGLVSVTFRPLAPPDIIALAVESGLEGIEWGGDVHVCPEDVANAKDVGRRTRDAGLAVAAYGSYYRVGREQGTFDAFACVIDAARALGAPLIRVWAGEGGSRETAEAERQSLVEAFHAVADRARDAGLSVAVEFHPKTLTDTTESAVRLFEAIDQPNVFSYWQIDWTLGAAGHRDSLIAMSPWLSHLHVFWREPDGRQRPLREGMEAWREYLGFAHTLGGDRYAMLEFVEDGTPENLRRDAVILRDLLDELY